MEHQTTAVVHYTNYNYAFAYFNQKYVEVCLSLSDTLSLREVRRKVSTLLYEFSYALPKNGSWDIYKKRLHAINKELDNDSRQEEILMRDEIDFRTEVSIYPFYYKYLVLYLELMSQYIADLSSTYLPRLRLQKRRLRFNNDMPFYEKLHEYKKIVFDSLSSFSMSKFRQKFNSLLIFFYAYKLFMNISIVPEVERGFSYVISCFVNPEVIDVLVRYPDYAREDLNFVMKQETRIHYGMLYCISKMNQSLSDYNILVQDRETKLRDVHLI